MFDLSPRSHSLCKRDQDICVCLRSCVCVCIRARLANNSSLVSYASACLSAFFFKVWVCLAVTMSLHICKVLKGTHIYFLFISLFPTFFFFCLSFCVRASACTCFALSQSAQLLRNCWPLLWAHIFLLRLCWKDAHKPPKIGSRSRQTSWSAWMWVAPARW